MSGICSCQNDNRKNGTRKIPAMEKSIKPFLHNADTDAEPSKNNSVQTDQGKANYHVPENK